MSAGYRRFVSPMATVIKTGDDVMPLWKVELRNFNQGFCGALFVALPLLYTLEMWNEARVLPGWLLVLWVLLGICICAAYFQFAGFRKERFERSAWLDAFSAMGIGLLASAVTLAITGRYSFGDSPVLIVRLIALEAVPTAIGASVAISQIGGRGAAARPNPSDKWHPDVRALVATILGSYLFAFNIAPTVEPTLIAYSVTWWHILTVAAFSLFVTWLLVYQTHAQGLGDVDDRIIMKGTVIPTVYSYMIALLASYSMLWLFGFLKISMPFDMQLATTVLIGYAATLGGAAGRVIL